MRSILIYNETLSTNADRKGLTMTGSVFILGGSLILILAAAWWVLHP